MEEVDEEGIEEEDMEEVQEVEVEELISDSWIGESRSYRQAMGWKRVFRRDKRLS